MPRYFSQRRRLTSLVEDDDAWEAEIAKHILAVCDHEATDTGLLDANGDPIMRAPRPIGFGRDDEW